MLKLKKSTQQGKLERRTYYVLSIPQTYHHLL